jgi:hypothetical protein
MNEVRRRKKAVRYEADAPRCETCVHFVRKHIRLVDSLPYEVPPTCRKHDFRVSKHGCCDDWTDRQSGAGLAE